LLLFVLDLVLVHSLEVRQRNLCSGLRLQGNPGRGFRVAKRSARLCSLHLTVTWCFGKTGCYACCRFCRTIADAGMLPMRRALVHNGDTFAAFVLF
jgi:hypothetical protein